MVRVFRAYVTASCVFIIFFQMPPFLNSPSGSKIFSEEALEGTYHFKWASIRNLFYLTITYSSHPPVFHLFNEFSSEPVILVHFTIMAIVVGMSYMCADLFIKQYTRRLDWDRNLSPVLKGVTLSLILQTTILCLLAIRYAGDGARFFASSLRSTPIWSICSNRENDSLCLDSGDIVQHCRNTSHNVRLLLNMTSAHIHYMEYEHTNTRGALTWRFSVAALIWILIFCHTTVPDSAVLKFYKNVTKLKFICIIIICVYLAVSTGRAKEAFLKLTKIDAQSCLSQALVHVSEIFGVGMVGVYEFGSTSPFTMIDNAIVIYTVCLIVLCVLSSLTVDILLLELRRCVDIQEHVHKPWHYIYFVMVPLATELLHGQKLVIIYLYVHVILSLLPSLMLSTLTITRLFHSEFPTVKIIYIVGLYCLLGFIFTGPLLLINSYVDQIRNGLSVGFGATLLYLGALRMAIIMWVYGINKFLTDIHFWLGYNPTKFWVVCWSTLPVVLLAGFVHRIYKIVQIQCKIILSSATAWIIFSALLVFVFQAKTVIQYATQNNLVGAFRSSKKYGPWDARDRKRRRRYDPAIDQRQCYHNCMSLDEDIECNHLPLMNTAEGPGSQDSENTLTMFENLPLRSTSNILEAKPETKEKLA